MGNLQRERERERENSKSLAFVTIQFPYYSIYIVFDIDSSSFAYQLYNFYIGSLDFALITYLTQKLKKLNRTHDTKFRIQLKFN